jgi:hypothetical protein
MTRLAQKQQERAVLRQLFRNSKIVDANYEDGERPDFIVRVANRSIGIEVTMFRSNESRGDHSRRSVEASWEELKKLWGERERNISVLLRFIANTPTRRELRGFLEEIVMFIETNKDIISGRYQLFWRYTFSSPLMSKYLWAIGLAKYDQGSFDSNLTAGFLVPRPAETIAAIVSGKSGKKFRAVNELWLVIHSSGRPSEMVLPINGASELDTCPRLQEVLEICCFSKLFIFTALGLLGWDADCRRWLPFPSGIADKQLCLSR